MVMPCPRPEYEFASLLVLSEKPSVNVVHHGKQAVIVDLLAIGCRH